MNNIIIGGIRMKKKCKFCRNLLKVNYKDVRQCPFTKCYNNSVEV